MNAEIPLVSMAEIRKALKAMELPSFDAVIGIGSGGVVPAALIAYELNLPLAIMQVNFRDEGHQPQRPHPVVLGFPRVPPEAKSLLLVDDVSVTGQTLKTAANSLNNFTIKTLVVKGQNADYVLLKNHRGCVRWPWAADSNRGN